EEPLGVVGVHAHAAVADVGVALGVDGPRGGVHVFAAPGHPGGVVDIEVVRLRGALGDAHRGAAHAYEGFLGEDHLDAVAGLEAGLPGGDGDLLDLLTV